MSTSLVGLHLSGNNLTPKQMRKLKRWLKIAPQDNEEIESGVNSGYPSSDDENYVERKDTRQNLNILVNGLKKKFVKKDIATKAQASYGGSFLQNRLIVTRMIGHPEMEPGMDEWKEVHDCWI